MAEPPQKKMKAKSIFETFKENKKKVCDLRHAEYVLLNGDEDCRFRFLKVNDSNARTYCRFPSARCVCEELNTREDSREIPETNQFSLANVFGHGWNVLHQYLKETYKKPKNWESQLALEKLLTFLSDGKGDDSAYTVLTQPIPGVLEDECSWAWRLAKHLLSKLALDDRFFLDARKYHNKEMRDRYPEDFGDTTFGVPDLWHGFVDILMDIPVTVGASDADADEGDQELDDNNTEEMNDAVRSSKVTSEADMHKLFAQAIVFSFLQKKKVQESNNFLIPCIRISKDILKVVLYDSVNDVLIENKDLPIFKKNKNGEETFSTVAVVVIWLTLNYRYLCTGLSDHFKKYKSLFHASLGESFLSSYQDKVEIPCKTSSKNGGSNGWERYNYYLVCKDAREFSDSSDFEEASDCDISP